LDVKWLTWHLNQLRAHRVSIAAETASAGRHRPTAYYIELHIHATPSSAYHCSICKRRISGPWISRRPAHFTSGLASLTAPYSSAFFSDVRISNSIFETKQKTTLFSNHSLSVQASLSPLIPGPDPRTRYSLTKTVSTKHKQSVQREHRHNKDKDGSNLFSYILH